MKFTKKTKDGRKIVNVISEEQKKEREMNILEMRIEKKMTLEAIAASLTPRITRERVRQILERLELREGIELPHNFFREKVTTTCHKEGCGEKITLVASLYRGEGRHGCSVAHRFIKPTKYVNPDGTPMTVAEKYRWIYHNVPGRKESMIKSAKAWHYRELAKKGTYYERYTKYQREYQNKRNAKKRLSQANNGHMGGTEGQR